MGGGVDRERALSATFVELADTLVSDFDVAELMQRLVENCVRILEADATGLMLTDQRGSLQVMASSTEGTRLLELFQIQANEGPCLDCFRAAEPVAASDLAAEIDRWPRFVPAAQAQGYAAVHAFPLRLRDDVIGAMNLFSRTTGDLPEEDRRAAQALADVAAIGILQERAVHHSEILVEQLQGALNSRVVIEQAKGLLAEAGGVDMDRAFSTMRSYARGNNARLVDVAADLINGQLPSATVLQGVDRIGSASDS